MSGMQSRLILEVSEIRRKEKRGYSVSSACSNEVGERQAVVLELCNEKNIHKEP